MEVNESKAEIMISSRKKREMIGTIIDKIV